MTATRAAAGVRPAQDTGPERAPWMIFWIALAVRIAYMTLARTWHMQPYDHHFAFGYEMGRIARALATGYGYADPFRGHTGPTAWITCFAGKRWPRVILAAPVMQPPSASHSMRSCGPAARWMAPSTPPPPSMV